MEKVLSVTAEARHRVASTSTVYNKTVYGDFCTVETVVSATTLYA